MIHDKINRQGHYVIMPVCHMLVLEERVNMLEKAMKYIYIKKDPNLIVDH